MRRVYNRITLAIVLALCVSAGAGATTITHTEFFSMPNDTASAFSVASPGVALNVEHRLLQLPLFDPAQGTLQSLELSFDTHWLQTGQMSVLGECLPKFGDCFIEATSRSHIRNEMSVELLSPLPQTQMLDEIAPLRRRFCNASGYNSIYCEKGVGISGSFDGTFSPDPSDLALFSGSGDILLRLMRWNWAEIETCSATGGEDATAAIPRCRSRNENNAWLGTVSVDYTYTVGPENGGPGRDDPNPVPAPGALALFAIGFSCLGLISRRRSQFI